MNGEYVRYVIGIDLQTDGVNHASMVYSYVIDGENACVLHTDDTRDALTCYSPNAALRIANELSVAFDQTYFVNQLIREPIDVFVVRKKAQTI